jgi:Asp-tRNA(Asn)/Glu-tRNA(Gln) amidotransferase A subunit family amidase
VLRQAFGEDDEIGAAMERAMAVMIAAGAVLIDPVALPEDVLPVGRPHVVDWEFGPAFDRYLQANFVPGTAPASLTEIMAGGAYLPEHRPALERRMTRVDLDVAEYRAILAYHREMTAALVKLLDGSALDALVYPTSMVTPRSLDNPAGGWAPELAANSGFPALTLPIGQASHGPFIGLEILARSLNERLLLGLGADLERRLARGRT